MKSTILAAAILFSLAGPVPALAEAPAVIVRPLAAAGAPIDPESSAQQTVAETFSGAEAAVTELAEPQVVSEIPAEVAAAVTATVAEQAAAETPAEDVAAGAMTSAADTPGQPCPMHGMGMMRKGMGPGGGKPGCDRDGRGQQNKHEQVVRRLDMIEARMAKIEAMLESLMQR